MAVIVREETIYLRKNSERSFEFFKVIFKNNLYCLLIFYDKQFKRRPRTFNLDRKPKLRPARNGWMTAPFKSKTIVDWDIVPFAEEKNTDRDDALWRMWRYLCGPTRMKPI